MPAEGKERVKRDYKRYMERMQGIGIKKTKLRRHMDMWLNTTGEVLKRPVEGKTNYLSGLNARGERIEEKDEGKGKEKDEGNHGEEWDGNGEGMSEDSKALGRAAQEDSKRDPRNRGEKRERVDPKTLMPFPLNPHFVSQSIPSEALRHEVWKRVQEGKKSVRQVSVELGVEMRRVGAIVRLVELERRMKEEVSRHLPTSPPKSFYDEQHKSISLTDFHHGVSQTNCNSLIQHLSFRHSQQSILAIH